MQDLNVTIIQCELAWEDPAANLSFFNRCFDRSMQPTDLVVLPEMFTTGFSMNARVLAQEMNGAAVEWIRNTSATHHVDITGSIIVREEGRHYNRLLWAKPDGSLHIYDKKHLFRMSGEHEVYSAGSQRITVELKGWNIRPFICYDLRFPSWTRNAGNQYDVAVYVANWPAPRSMHWRTLLKARAIENQSYVIGVNRVGQDGNGLPYDGNSSIIDPLGTVLYQQKDEPSIHTASLSYETLTAYRESFPAWMDADHNLALHGKNEM
ncbi:MAG: amidohydrolase [Deltaproteobacteria bacterium]|nr:amidohydrolase [Deltaproteobacteria bacterium]MBW2177872.1 amidohydrolase [Deltaproteobacteria bacterium]MBW2297474.1 amidohydrolase [Deltaproteobacteria bacterium]MBW2613974.1 amidohydrolase [Deltaproteobacteria bacterium]MBW2677721.1 amidohydrolase [Deltaproteobacteria bacterium]